MQKVNLVTRCCVIIGRSLEGQSGLERRNGVANLESKAASLIPARVPVVTAVWNCPTQTSHLHRQSSIAMVSLPKYAVFVIRC